jgi:signal transduction histidine kinase
VTAFTVGNGEEWVARLLLFGARLGRAPGRSLRLGRRLVEELVVILRARFLLGRVRSRLGAMERARVARELHDGTIQSLVAVEMEANVLRRRAERDRSPYAPELVRIERLVHDEILALRDTMERLKPLDVAPAEFVGFLDETVARFARESGLKAHFHCSEEDVDLPPRVCQELARIVQEALRNVRRHSGARNVVVRLSREEARWRLVVDDDGKGFPFEGRLSHEELDAGRRGPHVIKERVRTLGGELVIETAPGGGARLEIHVPREAP